MTATAPQAPAREPVKCARPGCPSVFIPYRSTHKFCTPKCKKTFTAYKFALTGGR